VDGSLVCVFGESIITIILVTRASYGLVGKAEGFTQVVDDEYQQQSLTLYIRYVANASGLAQPQRLLLRGASSDSLP